MWDDMMRRILQPVEGISPHVTSPYARRQAGHADQATHTGASISIMLVVKVLG
ncbi:hypothetical protein [Bradyrhizobium yuanmingense]|uniref:hypothetical protein n=1 Tax=Bradyrhizobium yuanmingense TaxID=108015 RepID=UPI001FCEAA94|nr:hypothetical protein [Bradyrhizobium yuanmingense]